MYPSAVQPVPAIRRRGVRAANGGRPVPQPGLRGWAASGARTEASHLRRGQRPGLWGEYRGTPGVEYLCVCFGKLAGMIHVFYFHFPFGRRHLRTDV